MSTEPTEKGLSPAEYESRALALGHPKYQPGELKEKMSDLERHLRTWLESATLSDWLESATGAILFEGTKETVARHAAVLSSKDGVRALFPILQERASALLDNRFATKESAMALVDLLLAEPGKWRPDRTATFFVEMEERGWEMDEATKRRIRAMAKRAIRDRQNGVNTRDGTGTRGRLFGLAQVPLIANSPGLREQLLYPPDNGMRTALLVNMLIPSKGEHFAGILRELVVQRQLVGANLEPLLSLCSRRNVEGLERQDLLFLAEAKDARIRAHGYRLISLVESARKTEPAPLRQSRQ